MVDYQKYLFDNFVVKKDKEDDVLPDVSENESLNDNEEYIEEYNENISEETIIPTADLYDEAVEDISQKSDANTDEFENKDTTSDFQPYDYTKETQEESFETTYTENELKEALAQAEEVAYNKGKEDASNALIERQNILLENIKNQLMSIFASVEEKHLDLENSALNFSIALVKKILPSLEKQCAEKEVKNFLAENFSNFSNQESLSFSFNPDVISSVADSIGRLAEQNDFEGKISVHKDSSLGLSDCKVEWKNGGVERKTESMFNKIENLININKQERENG